VCSDDKKIKIQVAVSLSLSYPSRQLEDGRWPGPTAVYHALGRGKNRATLDISPGLTRVTTDHKGPRGDPGTTTRPPRTTPDVPWDTPEHEGPLDDPGSPQDVGVHPPVSMATLRRPEAAQITPDTGGSPQSLLQRA